MAFKNLPFLLVSLFCLFLVVLLTLNMIENHHYKKILLDRAEDIISARMDELDERFNRSVKEGDSAFRMIDNILHNETTSIEEARELLDQLDRRLEEADELISVLSYGGSE